MRTLLLLWLLLPAAAFADGWEALKQDGAIAIMRHALAPGTGDPSSFVLRDCTTQRNLDERGRAQAQRIGRAFRERGVTFDAVYSSQWCRTLETAELLDLGPVIEAPALNSFFQDFSTRDRQTRETRALIARSEGRLMLVTHQVNISALTGRSTRSGEVLVIRVVDENVDVLGSIMIDP